jgi:hypothetical protein
MILKGGHAPRAMAMINNLIVGIVLHLGWTNLPEARRYYGATRLRHDRSSCVSWIDFGKALIFSRKSIDKRENPWYK